MNDLLKTPLAGTDDLGKPIPRWPHATSVCIPRWIDNIDYEQRNHRVVHRLTCGYPRFIYHPFVKKLFAECKRRFAKDGERCIALPSQKTASRCQEYLRENGIACGIHEVDIHRIHCVSFPEKAAALAACFWQHSGEGISSRQAHAALEHHPLPAEGKNSKSILRERIAGYTQTSPEHVFFISVRDVGTIQCFSNSSALISRP